MSYYKKRYIARRWAFRLARNDKIIKVHDLADEMGLSHGTCRNILSANQTVSLNYATKFAKALHKTINELFYIIGD